MRSIISVLQHYPSFMAQEATNRFFKYENLIQFLKKLQDDSRFDIRVAGHSAEGRSIYLVRYGSGPAKVFFWSQMHGNEATATMALLDIFNFLRAEDHSELNDLIAKNCTLYFMPMVNPDGAEVFDRRNAQGIDINRDFHHQQSPEGRLLRSVRDEISPEFGFNLHDQTTMWSAGSSGNPATISLLAPAFDTERNINEVRKNAMQVIIEMNETLQELIPAHVGRFDDEYEVRAFGDNFQAAGTSTILIEAGGYADDPEKQHVRRYFFAAMLQGLDSITAKTYLDQSTEAYFLIPENKLYHFQILLRNATLEFNGQKFKSDVGLIVKESINEDLRSVTKTYLIGDMGDLSNRFGYKDLECSTYTLIQTRKFTIDEPADLILMDGLEVLLEVENGMVTSDKL